VFQLHPQPVFVVITPFLLHRLMPEQGHPFPSFTTIFFGSTFQFHFAVQVFYQFRLTPSSLCLALLRIATL
jgi:hypothetical protein